MTLQQIAGWVYERGNMKRRYDCMNDGDHYLLTFENGETYEYKTTYDRGWSAKTAEIKLNGITANITKYIWQGFSYRAA